MSAKDSDRLAHDVHALFVSSGDDLRQYVSDETGCNARVEIEITPEMIEAAANEICELGITSYPTYPDDVRLAARQILEAALRAKRL